jgi:hypothetical protein
MHCVRELFSVISCGAGGWQVKGDSLHEQCIDVGSGHHSTVCYCTCRVCRMMLKVQLIVEPSQHDVTRQSSCCGLHFTRFNRSPGLCSALRLLQHVLQF